MDVEKTMEFLLEQQARFDAGMALLKEQGAVQQARFDKQMSDIVTVQQSEQRMIASLIEVSKIHEDRITMVFEGLGQLTANVNQLTNVVAGITRPRDAGHPE